MWRNRQVKGGWQVLQQGRVLLCDRRVRLEPSSLWPRLSALLWALRGSEACALQPASCETTQDSAKEDTCSTSCQDTGHPGDTSVIRSDCAYSSAVQGGVEQPFTAAPCSSCCGQCTSAEARP
jgi:hypothetical protein